MKLPVVVFASVGAGASIMMWTVKKILWPKSHPNNPLDHLNAAHNQSLYHWGGSESFNIFCEKVSQSEQVFHVEPLPQYMGPCQEYPSIFIHAHDKKSINEVSILTKKKLPDHYNHQPLELIEQSQIEKNNLLLEYVNQPNVKYFTFYDLAHGDLTKLLDQVYHYLNTSPSSSHDTIVKIHQRWREGNQRLWNSYNEH